MREIIDKTNFIFTRFDLSELSQAASELEIPVSAPIADSFASLYQISPTIRKDPPRPRGAKVMDWLLKQPAMHAVRKTTMLDPFLSLVGVKYVDEIIQREFPEVAKEREVQQLCEDIEQINDQLKDPDLPVATRQALEAERDAKDRKAWELAISLQKQGPSQAFTPRLTTSLNKLADDLKAAKEYVSTWGSEPGDLVEIMEDISDGEIKRDALKEILDIAGRLLKKIAQRKAEQPLPIPDDYEVEQGNDIAALTPSELALMAIPEFEDIFLVRYLERRLLTLTRTEREKKEKGPIVICVDESGSMAGQKERNAKAIVLAMAKVAIQEKRDFAIVGFDTRVRVEEFTKKEREPKKLLAFLKRCFDGGGTDFRPPMEAALDIIERKPDFSRADIIFITDGGADRLPEPLIARIKSKAALKVIAIIFKGGSRRSVQGFATSIIEFESSLQMQDDLAKSYVSR